jgi:glycosyltransferase involved in cell wall biosynthesis
VSNELLWRFKHAVYLAQRLSSSIAQRGWRGTYIRLMQERSRVRHAALAGDTTKAKFPVDQANNRRILVIDSMIPDPQRDSGSLRLCHVFQLLYRDGWNIDFLAVDGIASVSDMERLAGIGVHVHRGSIRAWLKQHGESLDAVMLCRLPVASQYLEQVRHLASRAKVIFDTVDLHFIREQRAAELNHSGSLRRHALRSRKQELDMIARSDFTYVVSANEQTILASLLPTSSVHLLTNIHEVHGRQAGFHERRDIVFVGGFGHPPNADAMRWFANEILPLLRESAPGISLHIVGDIDSTARQALERPGLIIHGRVEDIRPFMDGCRVAVAPLRFGAGVKGKVNLALSYGLPIVATTIAAEGMFLEDGHNVLIADSAERFAEAIIRLYGDEVLWSNMSDAGLENTRRYFSVERAKETLRATLGSGHREPGATP